MAGSPGTGASAARAELIADGGAAAVSEDFFRSPQFLEAEGVTHTLRLAAEGLELVAPLVVREVPGSDLVDGISPYGYPGMVEAGTSVAAAPQPVDPAAVDYSATGLVSAFLRHRLGHEPPLAAATPRNTVQLIDPALERKRRKSDRHQVNKNARNGYRFEIVPGPEASAEAREGFLEVYEQTMRHTGAAQRYFFGREYFELLFTSELLWLATVWAPGGGTAAASLATLSDGQVHYYLSGTADESRRDSPMKNLIEGLVGFAFERGMPVNLGGGISPGDWLEEFKRGFANREERWFTSELVCDRAEYERLSPPDPPQGFFPAYRA